MRLWWVWRGPACLAERVAGIVGRRKPQTRERRCLGQGARGVRITARNPKLPWQRAALGPNHGPGRGVSGELASLGQRVTLCLSPSPAAMKSGGTQLKLIMTFQNYGQALFKPMK